MNFPCHKTSAHLFASAQNNWQPLCLTLAAIVYWKQLGWSTEMKSHSS